MRRIAGGECLRTIKAHQMPVTCMAYDPTGNFCATGSADKSIRVWDVSKGYCTHSFREHGGVIRSLRFHEDVQRLQLISTSEDNSCRVHDLIESRCIGTFTEHVSSPTDTALSMDGHILISCGRDKVKMMTWQTI
jgi:U3 small nucleolar RNA-associated protein 13